MAPPQLYRALGRPLDGGPNPERLFCAISVNSEQTYMGQIRQAPCHPTRFWSK
jgi:hypothetical protein